MRMGGLGLRSDQEWQLHHIGLRGQTLCPCCIEGCTAVAERVATMLAREDLVVGCLSEVQSAARTLDRHGFVGMPDWLELRLGVFCVVCSVCCVVVAQTLNDSNPEP